MSRNRIILGPQIAASVRHGIFTIALPWVILYRTAGMEEMRLDTGFPAAGWILILLGAVLYIRAFGERIRMTAVVTAASGTYKANEVPTDDVAKASVVDSKSTSEDGAVEDSRPIWSEGVHGWSRNPLLLGVVLILFGACIAFESLILLAYAVLCWAWLTIYLVFAEEPALRRTLGDEYTDYCRQVPRWFLQFRSRK